MQTATPKILKLLAFCTSPSPAADPVPGVRPSLNSSLRPTLASVNRVFALAVETLGARGSCHYPQFIPRLPIQGGNEKRALDFTRIEGLGKHIGSA